MLADFKIKPNGDVTVSIGSATADVAYQTLVELMRKAALARHQSNASEAWREEEMARFPVPARVVIEAREARYAEIIKSLSCAEKK